METLSIAVQLICSLSFLILFHELGHFLAAKYFGVRVEKFYLFFDFLFPFPEVAKFSLFKKKIGDTEYGIGWFPFGGYVQMSGIMDESMDKEALAKPVQAYEFRAKPALQRLIILLGGIIVNIILAFLIYTGVAFVWGDKYLAPENAKYGIYAMDVAKKMGLQNGDIIIKVDGEKYKKFEEFPNKLILGEANSLTVLRNGVEVELPITLEMRQELLNSKGKKFLEIAYPCIIESFSEESSIEKAGAKVGDEIVALNGNLVESFPQFVDLKGDMKDTLAQVTVLRGGEKFNLEVKIDENGILGFAVPNPKDVLELSTEKYGFFKSFQVGLSRTFGEFVGYANQFKFLFKKENEGWKHIGSFGTFAKIFPVPFNLKLFLERTAFISVILAFMNLLPIPALDGGHALFTIYEMIFRKPPPEKFLYYAQLVGMSILLGLMALGLFNDIFR